MRVFAARQVSRGYPAQVDQKAYRVYLAQQGRPGSRAWQVRPGWPAKKALKASRDPQATKGWPDR